MRNALAADPIKDVERYASTAESAAQLRELVEDACSLLPGFRVVSEADSCWLVVLPPNQCGLAQGWKLHVSASILTAFEVLRRIVPVLLRERVQFKVARSLQDLAALNEGEAGISQIGKFVTVYPKSDAQAVRLAASLDQMTRGLAGPLVPSDRALTPGSAVHYRYGGFDNRLIQLPYGEIVPAIADPKGQLTPDRRSDFYAPPEWVKDPFVAAGIADGKAESENIIDGYLLPVSVLYKSPRGDIFLALDLKKNRRCVIKSARQGTAVYRDGRDSRDQLRNEYKVLCALMPDKRFPEPYALLERERETLLVMQDFPGETLASYVTAVRSRGRSVSAERAIEWCKQLAGALAKVHDHALIYRDLKPTNIILSPSGKLRIIDFELAHDPTSPLPALGLGTRGYMSPQQSSGAPLSVTDDIYSLGAVLYFMVSGAEPAQTPAAIPLTDRPLALLVPSLAPAFVALIERCLDPQAKRRFSTMSDLIKAIDRVEHKTLARAVRSVELTRHRERTSRKKYRTLANQLGETLIGVGSSIAGVGTAWTSDENKRSAIFPRDINTGTAGVVLALAELARNSGSRRIRRTLREGCSWLIGVPAPSGARVPGLYVGEAGIAAALLRAGQILGDAALVKAAHERARLVARLDHVSPDLFNGTAGRLRMHLFMWDETREEAQLRAARKAGEFLLETASRNRNGEMKWIIPDGFDGLSGNAFLGYAHGAAGIADSLLELYEVCGDLRFLTATTGAARWLARLALPALADRSGAEWPTVEDGEPAGAMWCHGSTGIGQFFLRASRQRLIPNAHRIAERAARSVAGGARSLGPVQCHGLAGSVEFLIDMFQETKKRCYLEEAITLGRLLEGFSVRQNGRLLWASDQPTLFRPDYMTGYAGIALCLLRLANPAGQPRHLSRELFRLQRKR